MCMYVYSSFSEGTYRHVIHTCVHMSIGALVKKHIDMCTYVYRSFSEGTYIHMCRHVYRSFSGHSAEGKSSDGFQNAFLDQECTEDEEEEQMLD